MWDLLKHMSPILVGQSIFSYLDFKCMVKLETALTNSERTATLCSFLNYLSRGHIEVNIPEDIIEVKWLQAHNFSISKATVHLDKINTTFETKMINEIELVDNNTLVTYRPLSYLNHSCYEKVTSISFKKIHQIVELMEKLFSYLHNLREVRVSCRPDNWIRSAIRELHIKTNNNILIEKICISAYDITAGSVVDIVRYCPRLQSLSVTFDIAENSLLALSRHCPLLKELQSRLMPSISAESAPLCTHVISCMHSIITPHSFHVSVAPNYERTVTYLTELRNLKNCSTYDHVFMPLFSQYCLKLETVEINDWSTTTTTQLLQLVQNCQHLHTIDLKKIDFCSDEFIVELTQRCSKLHKLSIVSDVHILTVTDSSLLALSEHCLQLRELYISSCIQITEAAVLQLAQSCKHLHILQLPLTCLSEDTVLTLPVTASMTTTALTLTFKK